MGFSAPNPLAVMVFGWIPFPIRATAQPVVKTNEDNSKSSLIFFRIGGIRGADADVGLKKILLYL
jgi:hypothetical protein